MNDRIELDQRRLLGVRITIAEAPQDTRIGDKTGQKPGVSVLDAKVGVKTAKLGPKNGSKPV